MDIYIYIHIYIYITNTRNPESPLLKVPEMWTAKSGPAWGSLSFHPGDDPLGEGKNLEKPPHPGRLSRPFPTSPRRTPGVSGNGGLSLQLWLKFYGENDDSSWILE